MGKRDPSEFRYKKAPTQYDPLTGELLVVGPDNPYCTQRQPIKNRCGHPARTCTPDRKWGGCGYRFTADDAGNPDCPVCGRSRLCRQAKAKGQKYCRHHAKRSNPASQPPEELFIKPRDEPKKLYDYYLEGKSDPALLDMAGIIKLLDERLEELLSRTLSHDSAALWASLRKAITNLEAREKELQKTLTRFNHALTNENANEMQAQHLALTELIAHTDELDELRGLVAEGQADYDTWSDIYKAIEQRRKTTESEVRRKTALHQMISVERLLHHYELIYDVIKRLIPDPRLQAKIGAEFQSHLTAMPSTLSLADGTQVVNNASTRQAIIEEAELNERQPNRPTIRSRHAAPQQIDINAPANSLHKETP